MDGGAIYASAGSTVNINNTTFTQNNAEYNGGAILTTTDDSSSCNITIINSTLTQNNARYGGGICNAGNSLVVSNNFTNNNAIMGMDIYNRRGTLTIRDNNFVNTKAIAVDDLIKTEYGATTVSENNKYYLGTATKIEYTILNDIEGKVAIDIRVFDSNNDEIANSEVTLSGDLTGTIKTNRPYMPNLNPNKYEITVTYEKTGYYLGNTTTINLVVVEDPSKTISDLNSQISTLQTNLANNITALNQANTDKETLQGQINTLNSQISTLQTNLANNITALNQANLDKEELQGQINTLNSQISTLVTPAKITKKATKITAKKKTFKSKVKVKKYTATVKSGKKAVAKVTVYLTIKGKKYKKTFKTITNTKGKATFKINNLNKNGKYKTKINYKGNNQYNKSSKTVKITIKE